MKFGRAITKNRVLILIVSLVLVVVSLIGMVNTRVNYDMLTYLPKDMDTVIGQDTLLEDFGKGAFTLLVVEDMPEKDVSALKQQLEQIDHVESVLWYDSFADLSIPMEMLPDKLYDAFNSGSDTLLAVFFDTSTSADETMQAIQDIRTVAGEKCFVTGMSALVTDLKELCEQEEPIYVAIAVLCACAVMMIFLDSWLVPFVFLASIGAAIVVNLGTNYFMGEISYLTKALAAVLQLAVTMDYSIFLWNSYNEQRARFSNKEDAMASAIKATLTSVVGSSLTTVAGFIALCFMSFTLGKDLGIVMAKGVVLGVIGCVTLLPALILVLDRPLQKTKHRSLLPRMNGLAKGITKTFPVYLVIFALLVAPAYYGYAQTNSEVYYDMGQCLPQDIDYVIANSKLQETFDIESTHMVLVDSSLPQRDIKNMIDQMEDVDGVKYVLGLESVVGSAVPEEVIPDSLREMLKSDRWELLLINSEYKVASDQVGAQIDALNAILKAHDPNGMLIGEAPCMKDMIDTTDTDFKVVNAISIVAIFVIILLVEKSVVLPFILLAVIELSIFINLGLPHYLGQSLPFIAPICISTIQLGATVDYAILTTTRYKTERIAGNDKHAAVSIALGTSIPSVVASALGLFAATFGVAVYSDIDIISSMCMLMARGAIVSMLCVIFILPAMLMLFDRAICATTGGMRFLNRKKKDDKDMEVVK